MILTPARTLGLALWSGLVTGLLELVCELVRRGVLGEEAWLGYYQFNRHYLWMMPTASVLVFGCLGVILSALTWAWPRGASRLTVYCLSLVVIFTLLLTLHRIHTLASLALAAGISVRLVPWFQERDRLVGRVVRGSLWALIILVGGLAAFSFGREALREYRAQARVPAAAGAPNVLVIVLDAVRADALSPYGAQRNTTPVLARLAREGVRFENARATAPWTLPSHASLFTGRFPNEFRVGVRKPLDATYPTLAEFLATHGYVTGGFAGNYAFCTWNYGLQRGFLHYEDRPVSVEDMLGSSSLGRQVFPYFDALRYAFTRRISPADPQIVTRRRSAADINRAFLRWRDRHKSRPFFAFLNYFDAHAPYIVPTDRYTPFGVRPESRSDYLLLRDWETKRTEERDSEGGQRHVSAHEGALARDGYDDCVAYIDRQIGNLLYTLRRDGLLENTVVVVTSDHGEQFGEHGIYSHFVSVHRPEVDVPLIVYDPRRIPAGATVSVPVSLRRVPSTVAELVGLQAESPFPGRSLAGLWSGREGDLDTIPEPVYSELTEYALRALRSDTKVYIHHQSGFEQLFDLTQDPGEDRNLATLPQYGADLRWFRQTLARVGKDPGRNPSGGVNSTRVPGSSGGADPLRR